MQVKINLTGIVQGVGFRPFIYRIAVKNSLKGYVRNRGDAGVEMLVEGSEKDINRFIQELREKKPALAKIHDIIIRQVEEADRYETFTIRESSEAAEFPGSVIPPDIAICDECLKELRQPGNPRHNYFFITCTDCGPRYTIIEKLPYDRKNTTMRRFKACSFCQSEYADPLNRRFHAQTVACQKCGPKVFLTTAKGEPIDEKDPIRKAGKLLSEGSIVAIKGYGGFHVATSTLKDEPLIRLRKVKHRRQKPFAVMARSLKAAGTFTELSIREAELLTAHTRPIVLLKKSANFYLSNYIAPGLHDVGVMLPYTGMHYMLFDEVDEPAFVMTSANPPNQPIIRDDDEALLKLGETVDYFLFHNRQIAQRCDDSVVRLHDGNQVFIRRSRGYAPEPLTLKEKSKKCVLGLGGELNNTVCILLGDRAFISQHIGDVENIETKAFLENTVKHLIHLTNSKVDAVVCDLHPKFATTKLAGDLAEQNNWKLIQAQHHYAHVAALMVENDVDEIVGICCDGFGFGEDGEAWGGEIILCTKREAEFKRLAHLEKQPLVGGDLATQYPLRMAASILCKAANVEEWLTRNAQHFPHGRKEIYIMLKQLENQNGLRYTTSCGRVLDAVAAVLGVCYERTYEGEPAMKLEAVALKGKDELMLKPQIKGNVLETTEMLLEIFQNRGAKSTENLAYSAHSYLARGLAEMAVEKAQENGVRNVGFSGGVACNERFVEIIRRTVEKAGLSFLVHSRVPPGDGGLSFGQAVIGAFFDREP